jgi:hypothetical protein
VRPNRCEAVCSGRVSTVLASAVNLLTIRPGRAERLAEPADLANQEQAEQHDAGAREVARGREQRAPPARVNTTAMPQQRTISATLITRPRRVAGVSPSTKINPAATLVAPCRQVSHQSQLIALTALVITDGVDARTVIARSVWRGGIPLVLAAATPRM